MLALAALTIFIAPAAAQEPLTLERCVSMALETNLRIAIADEKFNELDAAIEEAGTRFLPTVSGSASYTRLVPRPSGSIPIGADLSSFIRQDGSFGLTPPDVVIPVAKLIPYEYKVSGNVYNIGLNATQLIYTGGKLTNAKKIAEIGREASEWQRKSAVREIRRDVTKAYYNALAAKKSVEALDSAISLMEAMIKDMRNMVEVGMRGEHDLLQVEVQLLNQVHARRQAATGTEAAHNYLATLIGVPVNTPITLVKDLEEPGALSLPELAAMQTRAREASTDIKALEEQLKIIETSLLITEATHLPTVLASAGYSGQGIGQGKDGKWDNKGTLSLVAQWDIYNGGAMSKKKQQTLSQKRQLELTVENIRLNLDMGVKNGAASLADAFAGIETGRRSIEQTKRSYEISYDKFQEGMMLSFELLNAQNLCLQAEISYYASISTFYARQADLDYLLSGQ